MSTKYKAQNSEGTYFVTYATVGWVDVFTRIHYQEILTQSLFHCINHKGLVLHGWVIMPNHIHLICSTTGSLTLSEIMRDHKRHTSKNILKAINDISESRRGWMLNYFGFMGEKNPNNEQYQFWQQENHYIEIKYFEMGIEKLKYIHENPVRAGLVTSAPHYRLSSAIDYEGGVGLLPVEKLY